MAKKIVPMWILLTVLLSGCGPSIRLYSDMDDSARFEQYTTYSFLEFSEGNLKTVTGIELERIRVAFAKAIESRGLTFTEENGDVSVKITIFHRQAADGYGYWGVYNYMERAVSVDMYDNQSMKHIWHCAGVSELVYDSEERAAQLPQLVTRIFERYPIPAAVPI